ncbi:MAG: ATP-binding protein [Armatimonadota bacterium]
MVDDRSGIITFLFTDIEGSTRLLQHLGDSGSVQIFEDHRSLLRATIAEAGGHELQDQGDGFLIAFQTAGDAVRGAVAAQRALAAHPWPHDARLQVRMGLHTGAPMKTREGFVGLDVHRAARICQAGWGGQILISERTRELLENLPAGVELRDRGLHRLKDLQRPEHVFQVIHPELTADFPALRSLDPRLTNLPIQLSSFVGRDREIADLKEIVPRTRLITLTGPGGTGKTRLALQVAAELTDGFKDGVWLMEFAAVTEAAAVPRVAASVLNVREQPREALATTLAGALGTRRILLIFDNCEHVVATAAELADALLRFCPNLSVLSTSREPLGVSGETTYPVPSMAVPDLDHLPSPEALPAYEAIRLFVDRATAVLPTFRLSAGNAAAVVQVCMRLDGIPLAVELAAARVKVLSVEEIAKRLDERFRLLVGGSRTAPARHQTLQAAMDWSYGLLSEAERAVLRRLSVFAGGFTLEAAEGVCDGEGVEAADLLDLLSHLVDKSLVIADMEDGPPRYRMLETVRQYGRDHLREDGEEWAARERHRDWFLQLAERAEPELRGHQQSDWLDLLEHERDNLRAALEWSLTSANANAALRLAVALLWFWDTRAYFREGRDWLGRALAAPGPIRNRLRGQALIAAGHLAWHQSDYHEARTLIEEGLGIFTDLGDASGIADSMWFLGLVVSEQGDYAKAVEIYERGLALYRGLGDRRGVLEILNWMGFTENARGDVERATALHNDALTLARELEVPRMIAVALRGLGHAASNRGDRAGARALFEESLTVFRRIGAKVFYPGVLRRLSGIAVEDGDFERAAALLRESLVYCREQGEKIGMAACLEDLAGLAGRTGRYERVARLVGASAALRGITGDAQTFWTRDGYGPDLALVRETLGASAFDAAMAAGRAMTLEQALDYALEPEG